MLLLILCVCVYACFRGVYIHSKMKRKLRRFPIYPVPTHPKPSLLSISFTKGGTFHELHCYNVIT